MRIRRIVLVAVSGCLALRAAAVGADGLATVPPEPGEPVEFGAWTGVRYRIVGGPDWLAADEQHVFIRRDTGQIDVLDPDTGAIIRTVAVDDVDGHLCQGIGAGPDGIWSCAGTDMVHVDPSTGEIGTPVGVTKAAEQGHLVNAFDRVWVLIGDGSTLVGFDPNTGATAEEVALDARCLDVAVDESSVWVSCALDDVVLRIDPATSEVVDRIDATEPRNVAFSEGAVWLGGVSTVVRLDAETFDVVATIDGGVGRVGNIAADDAGVWVRRAGAPMTRIDTATNEITDELDLGVESGGDVLAAHGAVWTTAYDDAALFRIDLASGA